MVVRVGFNFFVEVCWVSFGFVVVKYNLEELVGEILGDFFVVVFEFGCKNIGI